MGKGEIARYEQFLLFPQCFQKACFPEASKGVIVWELVNDLTQKNFKHFPRQSLVFATVQNKAFENIVGTEENAGNQHFHIFPQYFLPCQRQKSSLKEHSICCLQMLSIWSVLKFCCLVKGENKKENVGNQSLFSFSLKGAVPFINPFLFFSFQMHFNPLLHRYSF